jgi:putative DNA primase/helicase
MVQVWRKTHYEYIENVFIEGFAQEHFNPVANTNKVREFRELICRTHLTPVDWFESTTRKKMNFINGVLDLSTWDFLEHSEEVGFRYVLPYEYNPYSKAPVFEKMLKKITGGSEELQNVLLEMMGYCLSNDTCWAQKAFVLVGEGANGKSTLMNTVKLLSGGNNYACLTMEDLKKSEYNRQMLDNKLFNFSEETPSKALVEHSLFKTLVTGGEIQVRSPYKEPYSIKNNAKLVFSCNELPKALDTTYGFYRRLIILPFDQRITKKDPDYDPYIERKLAGELPGIFNLAIEGYKRLLRQGGFSESKQIEATLAEYENETDSVKGWVKDNVKVHPINGSDTPRSSLKDMYLRYKTEVEYSGEMPITRKKFTKKLRNVIPEFVGRYSIQKDANNRPVRILNGVECSEGVNLE